MEMLVLFFRTCAFLKRLSYMTILLLVVCTSVSFAQNNNQTLYLNQDGQAALDASALALCFESEIITTCTPSRAIGDGHALWLSNNIFAGSSTDFVFDAGSADFTELADGTASITGTVYNTTNSSDKWQVKMYLSNKMNWTQWSALGRSYKDEKGLAGNNYLDWNYYIADPNKPSELIGLAANAGKTLSIQHMPSNYYYGFQIGTAANNKNADYGLSGWFSYSWDGVNFHQGDFNLDLSDCESTESLPVGAVTVTVDKQTFSCDDLGDNLVTMTAIDAEGNTCTQEFTVTIEDNIAPTVVTRDINRVIGLGGQVTITANDVLNFNCGGGTSIPEPVPGDGEITIEYATCTADNCTITSKELDKYTFDCNDIGVNTVTVTVTDQSGNSTTATASVTITDNQAPTVVAQDITIPLGADGIATITPEMINNGSNDGCGNIALTLSKTTFNCDEIGANTVTLIATDESGNTSTATATVTVVDDLAPEVVTQNILIYLDENGNGKIRGTDVLYICEGADVNIPAEVTPPANNGNGRGGRGGRGGGRPTPPTIDYSDVIVTSDVSQFTSCTSDNCSIVNATLSKTIFNCSDLGDVSVMVTVTDSNGNISTGMATVTVADNTPPTLTTQDVALSLDASGNATLTVDQAEVESADNCGIVSKELSKTSFDCNDIGVNPVTLTVTDNAGNQTVNTFNVTITDDIVPTVLAQDVTVILDNNGLGIITLQDVDNGSSDNCDLTLSLDRFNFDCSDVGQHTVTLTGTDPSGNTASATATVTVIDNTAPIAIAQGFEVFLNQDGVAAITPSRVDNGSNDNCGIASITLDRDTFGCGDLGQQTVTLTVTDTNGNSATATATITVTDNIAPTVVTRNIARVIGSGGVVNITANDVLRLNCGGGTSIPEPVPGDGEIITDFALCTTDNCTITSKTVSKSSFTCNDIGVNIVTVTVTDQSGNSTTATATVTITDNQAPVALTKNITVPLNQSGTATITPQMIDNGSNDGCGGVILAVSKSVFSCADLGVNTVTLIATDITGNVSTKTAIVTIVDNLAPQVKTQNISVNLDANGNARIKGVDLLYFCQGANVDVPTPPVPTGGGRGGSGPTINYSDITITSDVSQFTSCTADNCKITVATLSKNTFNCTNIGDNVVTVTVKDPQGNTTTATAIVTVIDNRPPTLTTQDVALSLDASGNAILSVSQAEVTSADNCSIVSKELSKTSFDCNDIGVNPVTLTVTDNAGNQTINTFNVTITDDIVPTVLAQDVTVILDNNGLGAITLQDVDNDSSDNCDLTLSLDRFNFDCSDVGQHTVTLTGTDPSGNTTSATATVTVIDNTAPTAIAQGFEVFLNQDGVANITTTQVDNGSNDNCGIASITLDRSTFGCGDLGQQTVTLTVTDTNGNSATATATITVTDNIAPTVVTRDINRVIGLGGQVTITANDVLNFNCGGGTSIPEPVPGDGEITIEYATCTADNCTITSKELDKYTFDCNDIGVNTVTVTVTDQSGNSTTATASVTITDNQAPTVVAQDITIPLGADGIATITPEMINNGSNDGCGNIALTLSKTTFNCDEIGANTVTLIATDESGNTSTATATVTVVDDLVPEVVTQNILIYLDENGNGKIRGTDVLYICEGADVNIPAEVTPPTNNGNGRGGRGGGRPTPPTIDYSDVIVTSDVSQFTSCTSDNCSIVNATLSKTIFNCSDLGDVSVMVTVTDSNGNISTGMATVTVADNIAPTLTTQNIALSLDASGNATLTVDQAEVESADNCGIVSKELSKTSFDCNDIGVNPVTLTVTDNAGNQTVNTFNVTITDDIVPTVLAQDVTVILDNNGLGIITLQDVDNGSSDNCDLTLSLDRFNFDCSDVGQHTVTLTGTDPSGNTASATATVTVIDNTAPIAIAQGFEVFLNQDGVAAITPSRVDNGSNDNCGIASITLDRDTFGCGDLGQQTVTLTVTDTNGNSATATATITVTDNIAPTVVTRNIARVIGSGGVVNITANDVLRLNCGGGTSIPEPVPGDGEIITDFALCTTDNCTITSKTVSKSSFTCNDIGVNIVTVTVTDQSGNSTTATATVTITDNQAPVALTKNITVPLNQSGTATITPQMIDNGSNDGCGGVILAVSKSVFSCADLGVNTVTLIATDITGNVSTKTAIVTIVDNLAPQVKTQNISVNLDANGNARIKGVDLLYFCQGANVDVPTPPVPTGGGRGGSGPTINYSDITITSDVSQFTSCTADNCKITVATLSKNTFNCTNIGDNVVTVTVKDPQGNTTTATAIVTVIDNRPPTLTTQDVALSLDASGNAILSVGQAEVTSADNCSIVSKELSKTSFDCNDIGVNPVTLTVTDNAGNQTINTFNVTITDDIVPTVLAQDVTVILDNNGLGAITLQDVDNGSSDNCDLTLSLDRFNFDCSDVGQHTVTLTGTDASGNTANATATVTVIDNIAPAVTTQDITLNLDANGSVALAINQIEVSSTDNCGVVSKTLSQTAFDCSNLGVNQVTYTVVDGAGNTTSETVNVTIVDNIAPTVVTQDATVYLDQNGLASITLQQIDNGSTDHCSLTLSLSQLAFDCSDLGANTVTLTGVDASGNTASATATVTVIDNSAPVITVQNAIINLDANGVAQLTTELIEVSSSDNCGIVSKVLSQTSFDCSDLGTQTITYTVTDLSGNSTTETMNVTITDTTAPVVITQDINVYLDQNGNASITVAQVDNGSSDNCNLTLSLDNLSFDCSNIGANTVTLTGTDPSGNTASATATVTVIDNIAPSVTTQDITINLDANGSVALAINQVEVSSSDNCSIVSKVLSKTTFDCSNVGVNQVTYTVKDGAGNTTSETVNVTIVDNIAPTVVTQDATVYLDQNGLASITLQQIDNGSTDHCSLTLSLSQLAFDCSDLGANTVTLTGIDTSGNTASATATVTVIDNSAPAITVQDATISLDANGAAQLTTELIEVSSSDNCGIVSKVLSQTSFDCSDLGTQTITYTVTDLSGNSTTETMNVTITDTTAPVVITQDINVYLDQNGNASITTTQVDNGSSDNCNITLSLDNLSFDCSNIGENTVTLTGTDASGNTANATATVTVIDNIAPVAIAQNITLNLDDNGSATITTSQINNGSTDNCGIASVTIDQISFDCSNAGENTITLTVTDIAGNVSTTTATVTVIDNSTPVITPVPTSVSLDENGTATISPEDVVQGVSKQSDVKHYGGNSSHAIYLSKYTPNNQVGKFHFIQNAGALSQHADGTATVTGTIVNINNANDSWAVQLNLIDKKSWTEWSALGRSWKGNAGNVQDNYLDWDFYIMDTNPSNPSTLIGLGSNVGKTKTLSHAPANLNYGFQVGKAANDKDTDLGLSGWFTYQNDQGNTVQGDFNLDITRTYYTVGDGPCATAEVTISESEFTCADLGQQTVTITATDGQGNTITETTTVTVIDDIAPTVIAKDLTVYLDENGAAAITTTQVDNGSSDNCNLTLSLDNLSFDCSNIGANTVTLTGTDPSGNTASATATVTVIDNIAPSVTTQDITISLDANGSASVTASQINNGSSDNCSITNISLSQTDFDCNNLGENTVTLTVTDAAGNTSTAQATVTVIDNVAPVVTTNSIQIVLNTEGKATLTASQLTNTVSDNCGIATVIVDKTDFDCSHLGENIVSVTATDNAGNTTVAQATVIILDQSNPVITGIPSNIVYQEVDNDCGQVINWAAPQATDNCSVSLTSTHQPGAFFPIGTTTVTYTATDLVGNSVSESFDVTVNVKPISISLDAKKYNEASAFNISCNAASDGQIVATVEGGCGSYQYAWSNGSDQDLVDNLSAGTYTLTVTDATGQQASKSITLSEPDPITIETNISPSLPGGEAGLINTIYLGYGQQFVTLAAAASGGNGNFSYDWSPQNDISCIDGNTAIVAPQVTTTYQVQVTDQNGCSQTESFTVKVIDIRCEDDDTQGPGGGDDDNNSGGNDDESCQCEGKMQNFTVTYHGVSGVTVKAYRKDKKKVFDTFKNVKNGDELTIRGFDSKGRLDSKTYLKVGSKYYKIHTSCSENIIGENYGPFEVTSYTDGQGATCTSDGGGQNDNSSDDDDDDNGKDDDDDDDDKGKDDDDDDDKKDDDDDDKGKDDDDDDDKKDDDDDDKSKDDDDDDDKKKDDDDDDNNYKDSSYNSSWKYGAVAKHANNPQSCQCDGGMKSVTVVYNGTSGAWIKAYNRWGNVILGSYRYVQNGQTLTINGYGSSGLLDFKTYFKVDSHLYLSYTTCYVDIVGKSFGPFTVTGFTDANDNTCSSTGPVEEPEVDSECTTLAYDNNEHALWLDDYANGQNAKYLFESGAGSLIKYSDGTAKVTGTVYNTNNVNDKWEMQFYLDRGMSWNEWSGLGRGYKDERNLVNTEYEDWTYYILDVNKMSQLIGQGHNLGRTKTISHMPSTYQFGFQVGQSANSKNTSYGISGWFYYPNDNGDWVQGDINMDLVNCGDDGGGSNNGGDCDLNIREYTGNITVCYNGEAICTTIPMAEHLISLGATLGSCETNISEDIVDAGQEREIEESPEQETQEIEITRSIEIETYPNPTSDLATISFTPSISGPTSVNVYNNQGHLISKVFEGETEANKTYSVRFDGSRVVSGLYMIRVNMSGFIRTEKLIIKR